MDLFARRELQLAPVVYTCLHVVTLDSFKETDRVPVGSGRADDEGKIYVKTLGVRNPGNPGNPFGVEFVENPQGEVVNETFVQNLVEKVTGKCPCDVLVGALSRVCLRGALDVFGDLVDRGVCLFSWDLWTACDPELNQEPDPELQARTMDAHFRLRVEDENARQQIEELGAGGRMWRHDNAFGLPIWD